MWYTNNRNEIIEGILNNSGITEPSGTQKAFLDAIVDVIPCIGCYKEEDREIKFDLAVGIDAVIENTSGRHYALQCCDIREFEELDKDNILTMLRKVFVLASDDSNIYACHKNGKIEVGIYCTDLEKTGVTESTLINEGFVLFQKYMSNSVRVTSKSFKEEICFDFSETKDIGFCESTESDLTRSGTYRTWIGVFEKIRRICHGTILLVVKSWWNLENDSNFKNKQRACGHFFRLSRTYSFCNLED